MTAVLEERMELKLDKEVTSASGVVRGLSEGEEDEPDGPEAA
jgi:hypothetical protein